MRLQVAGASLQGRRPEQQDCWLAQVADGSSLVLVADGLGGHLGGAAASRIVARNFAGTFFVPNSGSLSRSELLELAAASANDEVLSFGASNPSAADLGSTVVVASVSDGEVIVAHAGDSRAWVVLPDDVRLLTKDHGPEVPPSQAEEGRDSERAVPQVGSGVSRWLGDDSFPGLEVVDGTNGLDFQEPFILLLTSDGAHGYLTETDMLIALTEGQTLQGGVDELARLAFDRGSTDNVTVVACEVGCYPRAALLELPRARRALGRRLAAVAAGLALIVVSGFVLLPVRSCSPHVGVNQPPTATPQASPAVQER